MSQRTAENNRKTSATKFIVFSLIGIALFFTPFYYQGNLSIPIDHLVTFITETFPAFGPAYVLLILALGAVYPFVTRTWNSSVFEVVFSILKIFGFVTGVLIFFNVGPDWLMNPALGPFLYNDLLVSIGLIVPLSGLFLTFLSGYGLLEFFGVFFHRIMRPVWKVPGRAAVNALASRVASVVVVHLMTNQDYKAGKYTAKEAVIITTGFVAVEIPFMVIIARTLDIMHLFPLFFILAMVVTFIVTAITARIWPIRRMSDQYHNKNKVIEELNSGNSVNTAWDDALKTADRAPSLARGLWTQLREALVMTMAVLPAILSIGVIALFLAEYTNLFDYVAYIFYPLTSLLQIPDAMLVAKGAPLGLAEILLPSLLVIESGVTTKMIVAVVSVSAILFFSTTIPSILATDIPVSVWQLVMIWLERVVLSFVIATPLVFLLL